MSTFRPPKMVDSSLSILRFLGVTPLYQSAYALPYHRLTAFSAIFKSPANGTIGKRLRKINMLAT
jgi:hypothetical protein